MSRAAIRNLDFLGGGATSAAVAAGWFVSVLLGWYMWRHRPAFLGGRTPNGYQYVLPSTADRERILRTFRRAEQMLADAGFRRRLSNESYTEYASAACRAGLAGTETAPPLAAMSSAAAYSSAELPAEAGEQADASIRALEADLERWRERQKTLRRRESRYNAAPAE